MVTASEKLVEEKLELVINSVNDINAIYWTRNGGYSGKKLISDTNKEIFISQSKKLVNQINNYSANGWNMIVTEISKLIK